MKRSRMAPASTWRGSHTRPGEGSRKGIRARAPAGAKYLPRYSKRSKRRVCCSIVPFLHSTPSLLSFHFLTLPLF